MRISTNQIYNQNMRAIMDNQAELSKTSDQIASGKRIASPSDDPVGAAKIIRLAEQLDNIEQYKQNINLLQNNLELQDTVFGRVQDNVNRARVLTVQSGSGIVSFDDRQAIKSELEQIRDEVFALMNSRNSAGDYVFAGSESGQPAFSYNFGNTGNKYSFDGNLDTNEVKISDSVEVRSTASGQTVFQDVYARKKYIETADTGLNASEFTISAQPDYDTFYDQYYSAVTPANNQFAIERTGANELTVTQVGTGTTIDTLTFTPNERFQYKGISMSLDGPVGTTKTFELAPSEKKNLAETINDFVIALGDPGLSQGDYESAIADALIGLDNGLEKMSIESSSVGARMNIAEAVLASNLDLEISAKTARAGIQDLDFAEATARFALQENAYNAALATFPKVTGMSLFEYI